MAHSGITFPCKLIEKTLPFGYIVESFTGIFLLKRYSIHEILHFVFKKIKDIYIYMVINKKVVKYFMRI